MILSYSSKFIFRDRPAPYAGVENPHGTAGPVGDEQMIATACESDVVGPRAGRRGLEFFLIREVNDRDCSGIDVEYGDGEFAIGQ